MWALLIILAFVVFTFIFNIFMTRCQIPARGYKKRLLRMNKYNESFKRKAGILIFLQKFIKLDGQKRVQTVCDIERCNMNVTPEEFYADAILSSVIFLLCVPLFIVIGLNIMCVPAIVLAVMMFFKKIKILDEKIKILNEEIINELPMFIRNFSYNLESTRDIVEIIDRYRKIAGRALKVELDILVTDLKTGNYESAISKFDRKLNIDHVSSFASGIMGISRGIDYKTYFYVLEENMKIVAKENLIRRIKKRPAKLQKCILVMVIFIGLLYMTPILIQMVDGLSIFK